MTGKRATIWTFVLTSVALFMVVLDNLVVTTALPTIQRDLGASIEDLEWPAQRWVTASAAGACSASASACSRWRPPRRRSHRASAS